MTGPAQELRTAAQALRDLATAASTDRYGRDTSTWTSHHINERTALLHGGPEQARIIRGSSSGPHGRGVHPHLAPAHADYIAAMGPNVGTLLADTFTAWARMGELDPGLLNRVGGPETLVLARAINTGGQP